MNQQFPAPNPRKESTARLVESMPVAALLGITVEQVDDGTCVLSMPCSTALTSDGSTVQGGIVATLADFAAVSAASTLMPPGWFLMTTGVETHHLAPARGARLIAVGRSIKSGGRTAVAAADVYLDSADGTLCLTARFSAAGIPPR